MFVVDDLAQVSWQCVHFLNRDTVDTALQSLKRSETAVAEIQKVIGGEEELFAVLADALQFPAHFGMNWDALDECLRDMEWMPAEGYAVFFFGAEQFWCHTPRLAGKLVSSWLFSAEEWGHRGVPFHLVFVW